MDIHVLNNLEYSYLTNHRKCILLVLLNVLAFVYIIKSLPQVPHSVILTPALPTSSKQNCPVSLSYTKIPSSPIEFATPYATRVARNIEKAVLYDETEGGHENISVAFGVSRNIYKLAPDYRFGNCEISKSMSTVMMNIFCYLYDSEQFVKRGENISTGFWEHRGCAGLNELNDYDKLYDWMPGNFRFVGMVRDPLARFESGYLDKCVRENKRRGVLNPTCFKGCQVNDIYCVLQGLKELLKVKRRVRMMIRDNYIKVHLTPQTWYCNIKELYRIIAFIKYGSHGEEKTYMIGNMTEEFRMAGIPEEKLDYIRNSLNENVKTVHSTESMEMKGEIIESIQSNRTLYDLFMSIYKFDYDIFEFPYPEKKF